MPPPILSSSQVFFLRSFLSVAATRVEMELFLRKKNEAQIGNDESSSQIDRDAVPLTYYQPESPPSFAVHPPLIIVGNRRSLRPRSAGPDSTHDMFFTGFSSQLQIAITSTPLWICIFNVTASLLAWPPGLTLIIYTTNEHCSSSSLLLTVPGTWYAAKNNQWDACNWTILLRRAAMSAPAFSTQRRPLPPFNFTPHIYIWRHVC